MRNGGGVRNFMRALCPVQCILPNRTWELAQHVSESRDRGAPRPHGGLFGTAEFGVGVVLSAIFLALGIWMFVAG